MKTISVHAVVDLVRSLCIQANYHLPKDLCQQIETCQKQEQSPLGQTIFEKMVQNYTLAREQDVPICQDTGMAVIFVEIGQDVHLVDGSLEDAIQEGVRRGYREGYLRCSIVGDPLERVNTGDNTPAVIYTALTSGDALRITVAPKGFGSENMSALKMFTPAASKADIVQFIVDTVVHAGSNPCPPVVVGVGLGGTSDKAMLLAKQALLRDVSKHHPNPLYAQMEEEIVQKINASGVGPQGLGGSVTALACAIEPFATHIAGLPCAVNIGCHVTRHAQGVL